MPHLDIYLLGGFQATIDDKPLSGIYDHVRALLAYVAYESHRPHRREALAELLWPNETEEVARRNLRQALSRLRAALGEKETDTPFLLIDRATIQFNRDSDHFIDTAAFLACGGNDKGVNQQELSAGDVPWLEEASSYYRGDFLDQLHLPDNPAFDQWIATQAEDFRQKVIHYLDALARHYESVGSYQKAIDQVRRQIEVEPWHEAAHRRLMRLLAKNGHRSAALAQYNTCRAVLMEELGVDPEPETEELRSAILEGDFDPDNAPSESGDGDGGHISGRRQVTVVYCGLTEPEDVDPEDFIDVLHGFKDICRQIASRYDAHLEDSHGGAQILFFGFPQAHGNDASRAVSASLQIIENCRELSRTQPQEIHVRAGVHTGLMIATAGGANLPVDLIGTPLNVAMQLRFAAGAGGVLISRDTERLVRSKYELIEAPMVPFLEAQSACPAFQVLSQADEHADDALRGTADQGAQFVGRESELALLQDIWARCRQGQSQIVVLDGDAGIGKSRLIQNFRRRIQSTKHRFLGLRCGADIQSSTALDPVLALAHDILDLRIGDSAKRKRARIGERLQSIPGLSPDQTELLERLLGIAAEDEDVSALNPQQQKQHTLSLLVSMLLHEAAGRPVLLVVEDLQWVDPTSMELLRLLSRRMGDAPIAMVMTCRPGTEHPWQKAKQVSRMSLVPLNAQEVKRLATVVARNKALPEEIIRQIVDRTDGIPLFVEELTRSLIESRLLRETLTRFELTNATPTVALPFTLHDSLMARLDRLGTAKTVAQLGAVLGREFPRRLLDAICELEPATLQRELARLEKADLLQRQTNEGEVIFSFRHALIQEVAYESLLRRHRQTIHGKIAAYLAERLDDDPTVKVELLAHHFQEAGEHERAVRYWHQAGLSAARRSAFVESAAYLRRGLELLEQLPEGDNRDHMELQLRIAIGIPLMLSSGPVPEIEQAYGRALELSEKMPENRDLFPAIRGLYTYYVGQASYQTAEKLAQQLVRIGREQNRTGMLLEGHRALGTVYLLRGELTASAEHLGQTIGLYNPIEHHDLAMKYGMDPGLAALSLLAINDWVRGNVQQAKQRMNDCLKLANEFQHPSSLGWVLNLSLTLMQLDGQLEELETLAEQLHALAERHEMQLWIQWSQLMLDKALIEQGKGPDRGVLRERLASFDRIGPAMGRPYELTIWAETCLEDGAIEEGLDVIREALTWITQHNARLHEAELHRLHGELLVAADDERSQQADAAFNRAIFLARAQGARAFELRAAERYAAWLCTQGKQAQARELLSPALAVMEDAQQSRDVQAAMRTLAYCHG